MIYHTAESLKGTGRYVQADGFVSIRLALAEDNLGFTVTEATGRTEIDLEIQHKNHIEAVYVLEGTGEVELVETGEVYRLYPGVFYAFDKHERHRYRLDTEVRAIAIFNPPLVGDEINDEEGGYASAEDHVARD
ncbi:MAG: ectoine synthase [Gammaproteobacteria bacterium]|nr:ectoine synthase [Gammaproteobacteria bacterium]